MQQCVLDRHISRVHAEMVKCPECDKSVSQPRLDAHMATHVAKSVTCNECSFEAASSHSLEQVRFLTCYAYNRHFKSPSDF